MMRSLFSGVSGLKNHQTRMDVIGNNISNVNTTGYKSSRVNFTDMLSQTLSGASTPQDNVGGTNPKQIGLGSAVGAIDLLFTNGSVQSTGVNTDLALSSTNALFILNTGNGEVYTRNGDFQFDANGNYVQAGNGYYVQGWTADQTGYIDTQKPVDKINIPSGKMMEPAATTKAVYMNNLNAEVPTITAISGGDVQSKEYKETKEKVTASTDYKVNIYTGDPATKVGADVDTGTFEIGDEYPASSSKYITKLEQQVPSSSKASADNVITLTLSDGSKVTQTSGLFTLGHSLPVVTTLAVYDTLGSVHDLPVYFTMVDAAQDTWEVTLTTNGDNWTEWTEKDGSTTRVTMDPVTLDFDEYGKYDTQSSGQPTLQVTNGAKSPYDIILDLQQLTQYSASSTISGNVDGNASGTLTSISIDKTGTITGTYSNGMKQAEAQVALMRFNNPGGLTKVGESLYEDSNNAGKDIKASTASDLGATITPAALEMSNVDVANEFTDMIITQRGFQGNSKIITVSDEMLETLINMKR